MVVVAVVVVGIVGIAAGQAVERQQPELLQQNQPANKPVALGLVATGNANGNQVRIGRYFFYQFVRENPDVRLRPARTGVAAVHTSPVHVPHLAVGQRRPRMLGPRERVVVLWPLRLDGDLRLEVPVQAVVPSGVRACGPRQGGRVPATVRGGCGAGDEAVRVHGGGGVQLSGQQHCEE